ncbi:PIG-L family deacetylase [Cytophagaceae bacterium YF14B1]|uniref:PIG-L family deacetylase n=1 Tax=Xanthocytophaga flava TaxID=3048013 RepID=A0AAE3UBA0_9BACT|nr:PIG-L family deacetylase [Xanthocytophaga flavus]MDJ1483559.1 PIG-L family deacetylase [Xanthocytophaga flavus]
MKTIYTVFLFGLTIFIGLLSQAQTPASQTSATKTILAIFAHPDDEVAISPVLARYARQGTKVYLAIATDGQQGVTPHAKIPAGNTLGKVRRAEATCACQQLGIKPPVFFGLQDGGFYSLETLQVLHQHIVKLFTELKPDVVITWGPDGGYGHADHRIVSDVVTEVFQTGANNGSQQLLYTAFPKEAMQNMPPMKTFTGKWLSQSFHTTRTKYLTYQIPYEAIDLKTARTSYACHKSQFTPDDMDEIFLLIGQGKGKAYLRPWNGSSKIQVDLFK